MLAGPLLGSRESKQEAKRKGKTGKTGGKNWDRPRFCSLPPHRQRGLLCICYQVQPLSPAQGTINSLADRTADGQPKGVRDISCILPVEEQSGLLRSTGKTGQKPAIALTPFTPADSRSGVSRKLPRMVPGTRPVAGFQPGTRVVAGNCSQAMMGSSAFARGAQKTACQGKLAAEL